MEATRPEYSGKLIASLIIFAVGWFMAALPCGIAGLILAFIGHGEVARKERYGGEGNWMSIVAFFGSSIMIFLGLAVLGDAMGEAGV